MTYKNNIHALMRFFMLLPHVGIHWHFGRFKRIYLSKVIRFFVKEYFTLQITLIKQSNQFHRWENANENYNTTSDKIWKLDQTHKIW